MTKTNFTRPSFTRLCRLTLLAGCSLYGLYGAAHAQDTSATTPTTAGSEEPQTVVVLGSRIPRTQKEGPAPVTVITSDQIRAGGYASVPDVLKTVTQNSGETESQQSGNAADYSPGAQQVDLRGLGPNHTLVMVNGRRISDFPMPFDGNGNFTDISNIPLGMVDQIEILSGSASAIYGSDALAGVVNFKLKERYDGSTLDYRYGWTEKGGGQSHRLNYSSGFDAGKFHGVFGGEILWQDPIYGYQRKKQDSTLDAPDPEYQTAITNWQRVDYDVYAIDATDAQCALTTSTNNGTTHLATDDYYSGGDNDAAGNYCGSESAAGYRTIQSERHAGNLVGSFTYDYSDTLHFFADVQFGVSQVSLLKRPTSWSYQTADGDDTGDFYNSYTGGTDNWYRIFTPEEMGGLDKAMRHVNSTTYTLTPGVRGTFGKDDKWNYEVALNYSAYTAEVIFPLINAAKANALFLGTQDGEDDDYGLPVFNADPTRFYTPLTVEEYDSIAENAVYHPKSSVGELTAQIGTRDLFQMPAGPVGFNFLVEGGRQDYDQGTDPKAAEPYFFSWTDFISKGHRTHYGTGVEFSIPLLSTLSSSLAARYDHYSYAEHDVGQATYNLGLEYRPLKTLLLRAAWGTGFRAPDLNYVYQGIGYEEGRATDYYACYNDTPEDYPGDCGRGSRISVQTGGNRDLDPETSESFNTGFVWAPSRAFDLSVDYYKITMKGVVEDLVINNLTRTEGECRNGIQDINSPTCQDAIARVTRDSDGDITQVYVSPINVAEENTSGIDVAAHLRFDTPIGILGLSGSYTHAIDHDYTRYAGDTPIDKLAYDSGYYIPRNKASGSVNLKTGKWKFNIDGNFIGRLPNYDEDGWVKPYTLYNASAQYEINEKITLSLAIDNLLDTDPSYDSTWTSYPYYNSNWYDGVGRSGFLQITYKY
ncbi:MAG: TonB-dependent receptor [Asticcacaulis sp.]|uniref:TonB-dependent receptor plug domain-containing protein n=1 Tax=Asticcacaulis sp. TaxID=1872648 RepID=UPI0039E6FCB0